MSNNHTITVKFWGVRGSYPMPGADTVHFGGNTPCVEVRVNNQSIILDAGTGIIPLGRDLVRRSIQAGQPIDVTLLFSHMHHDHTQGFPFFTPAFILSSHLHIYGPHTFAHELEQILAHNMVPPVFPVTLDDMGATKEIHSLSEHQVLLLGGEGGPCLLSANSAEAHGVSNLVRIRVLRSYAHPGGVMIYRIEWQDRSVVYATDTEGYANTDRRLVEFARGADLLIHDAQYTEDHYLGALPGMRSTQGWGHSTAAMACDVAGAADVKRLALFHYDPSYADPTLSQIETHTRQLFPGAFAPYEGLEVVLDGSLTIPHRKIERRPSWPQTAPQRVEV